VRKGLIDTVLATDMSRHFVLLNKFTTVFGTDEELLSGEGVSEVSCPPKSSPVLITVLQSRRSGNILLQSEPKFLAWIQL
jgi:hypothetical protein